MSDQVTCSFIAGGELSLLAACVSGERRVCLDWRALCNMGWAALSPALGALYLYINVPGK